MSPHWGVQVMIGENTFLSDRPEYRCTRTLEGRMFPGPRGGGVLLFLTKDYPTMFLSNYLCWVFGYLAIYFVRLGVYFYHFY